MTWEPEVKQLEFRKRLAEQMGGTEGVARQHKQGKLTVRERIALLADPGSFREWNALTGGCIYQDDQLQDFTLKPSFQGLCNSLEVI
jgi:acetyl-CoA carboxylase carboxyltransferase component